MTGTLSIRLMILRGAHSAFLIERRRQHPFAGRPVLLESRLGVAEDEERLAVVRGPGRRAYALGFPASPLRGLSRLRCSS